MLFNIVYVVPSLIELDYVSLLVSAIVRTVFYVSYVNQREWPSPRRRTSSQASDVFDVHADVSDERACGDRCADRRFVAWIRFLLLWAKVDGNAHYRSAARNQAQTYAAVVFARGKAATPCGLKRRRIIRSAMTIGVTSIRTGHEQYFATHAGRHVTSSHMHNVYC